MDMQNLVQNLSNISLAKITRQNLEKKYRIIMKNDFLNPRGRIAKKSKLVSTFNRLIIDNFEDVLYLTNYKFHDIHFSEKSVKKGSYGPIEWTFPLKMKVGFNIYNTINTLEEKNIAVFTDEVSAKTMQNVYSTFECVSKFPKLPSVYLMVMQIMDIFAFEMYLSYIHSIPELKTIGKKHLVNFDKFTKTNKVPIDFGLYQGNSFFEDSDLYMTNLGITYVNDRHCLLYEYICDGAKVQMEDRKSKIKSKRLGSSYYSGKVFIDLQDGNVVRATMLESYIAMQYSGEGEAERKVPVHVRRNITMDLV